MIQTLSRVARAYARSREEIHRYASAMLYDRRWVGASARLGPAGGGEPVLSDLSDWRSWPERREARNKAVVSLLEEGLQEALIMGDDDTRRRTMCALEILTCDLSTANRVRPG